MTSPVAATHAKPAKFARLLCSPGNGAGPGAELVTGAPRTAESGAGAGAPRPAHQGQSACRHCVKPHFACHNHAYVAAT